MDRQIGLLPGFSSLFSIAEKLGISLDWLVCGKGPVYYKEKEKTDREEEIAVEKMDILQKFLPGFSRDEINDFLGERKKCQARKKGKRKNSRG